MTSDAGSESRSPASADLLRRRVQAGGLWLPVEGDSMGRTIRAGSEVLLEVANRGPRLGEVWAYVDAAGVLVVHRYLGRRGRSMRFAGDAQHDDPPVEPSMLVGRAVRVRRNGRTAPLDGVRRLPPTAIALAHRTLRGLAVRLGARRVRRWLGR
ncbi:MAG: S24/S26 family peptidase [Dehalococcoidia bacterium]